MSAFAFAFPAVLTALVLLPAIWWLLRLTPPKPLTEAFPPFAILASIMKREETPAQSPWWLTLLRMLMAAAVIFAIADPVLNPRVNTLSEGGPLALVIDNSWASSTDWQRRCPPTGKPPSRRLQAASTVRRRARSPSSLMVSRAARKTARSPRSRRLNPGRFASSRATARTPSRSPAPATRPMLWPSPSAG